MKSALVTHNPLFVYLAGPIAGCTEGEAKDWRKYVNDKLEPHNLIGVSPLRCEPLIGERYDLSYADPCFGMPKSILAKNIFDLKRCDMTLAYFPDLSAEGKGLSTGTIGEVSWAYALNKPCVVVSKDPRIRHHPFTSEQPSWPVLDTLDEGLRLLVGILEAYTGGKNV